MKSLKRRLVALYLVWLIDERVDRVRNAIVDIVARFWPGKREVTVFLQLDDPYSWLLGYYIRQLQPRYAQKVRFRFYLCQALSDHQVKPELQMDYALRDCRLLARALGIPFLDVADTPAIEFRRALMDFLAAEHEEEFGDAMLSALELYWRGDNEGIARLIGKRRGDPADTSVMIGRNQLRLRKMGHYAAAMAYYAGEWYWGIDRLVYLTDRLDRQRLRGDADTIDAFERLRIAQAIEPPLRPVATRVAFPRLEMFFSFRSPYSYLALESAFELADAYGIELVLRPVLPMVMRGAKLSRAKARYIVTDANREARRKDIRFGRFVDPLGAGVENCMAGFVHARAEGRERDFAFAAMEAAFADGIDLASDDGLTELANRAGLDEEAFRASLKDDAWRREVDENRSELEAAGLWGVPSFRLGRFACWGQDRIWLLSKLIADNVEARSGAAK